MNGIWVLYHVYNDNNHCRDEPLLDAWKWIKRPGVLSTGSEIYIAGTSFGITVREDHDDPDIPIQYDMASDFALEVRKVLALPGWATEKPPRPSD